jgi:predicted adenylyl cyclase CyaB
VAINVEVKARVRDWQELRQRAASLSRTPAQEMRQRDVFFVTVRGRLKLRVLAPDRGQLVYYERVDLPGPKPSRYLISEVDDPGSMEAVLSASLGVRGVVSKVRLLYLVGHTRIHLDQVEGLGRFLELEAMMSPGQSAAEGEQIVSELLAELGIGDDDLIDVAYIDLLEASKGCRGEDR